MITDTGTLAHCARALSKSSAQQNASQDGFRRVDASDNLLDTGLEDLQKVDQCAKTPSVEQDCCSGKHC